ncbi:MAG TPA: 3'(2'),5'-bisphosphate nucleotidase [Phycisphaerae bacterium]|nr:3'(2'),5'-bisphosphate nucleotidase [Phycisphaerales bacterium]HRX86023.1 3'(2'),5'-bisphosphate nucleotidase [Phycisphaerae bacterium]
MTYKRELDIAIKAVARACGLCTTVQRTLVTADTVAKKDRSPVTVADFGVQAVVAADLIAAFPDVPMVGEEDASQLRGADGAALRGKVCTAVRAIDPRLSEQHILAAIDYGTYTGGASGRHWALDPIDGTKGFLRGDQYAVALALVENGQVVLGVLGCPNLPMRAADPEGPRGCLFFAQRGGGAFQRTIDAAESTPIHVSAVDDPAQATFCESVESAHTAQDDSARIAQRLGVTAPPFRIDSQCKYAAIARGDSAIYLRMPTRADYEEKIWDHAAGAIIVTEAGGRVTDITGAPLDFSLGRTLRNNRGVVATNGLLHDRVIAAV